MSLIDGFLGPILLETMEKKVFPPSFTHSRSSREGNQKEEERNGRSVPVDIAESQKEYVFYFDVPGLSKSDIQVTLEEKNVLVVKGGGKRKREEEEVSEEEEGKGCKYLRMERNAYTRFMRKFRLPVDADLSAISARCENGVLTVSVEKVPPVAKSKTVEITVS
ncbi:17.4 kDa class III heat shock protein [Acorus calamus]|uniref:17.4 kDa class III heat shock protein n=1 Tax=Acorus calamus TaxID=4465 RepID=A0AAV9EIM8_ACOCL|nr:17.4 kDa class III heat shock protein [Acorus calamus]